MKRLSSLILASILLLAFEASAVAQGLRPATRTRTPLNTVATVVVDDLGQMIDAVGETNWYSLTHNEDYKSLVDDADRLDNIITPFKNQLAQLLSPGQVMPFSTLQNPFSGTCIGFITANKDESPLTFEMTLAFTVADHTLMKTYIDRVATQFDPTKKKYKKTVTHKEYRCKNQNIHLFTAKRSARRADGLEDFDLFETPSNGPLTAAFDELRMRCLSAETLPPTLAVCQTARYLIISTSASACEAVIEHLNPTISLKETPDYLGLFKDPTARAQIRFRINTPKLLSLSGNDAGTAQMRQILGVDEFGPIEGSIAIDTPTEDFAVDVTLSYRQPIGICRLLSQPNYHPTQMINTPSSDKPTVSVLVNANLLSTLAEVETITRKLDPAIAGFLARTFGETRITDKLSINWRRDILSHLEPPITFTLDADKLGSSFELATAHANASSLAVLPMFWGAGTASSNAMKTSPMMLPKTMFWLSDTHLGICTDGCQSLVTGQPTPLGIDHHNPGWFCAAVDLSELAQVAAKTPTYQRPIPQRDFDTLQAVRATLFELSQTPKPFPGLTLLAYEKLYLDASGNFADGLPAALMNQLGFATEADKLPSLRRVASKLGGLEIGCKSNADGVTCYYRRLKPKTTPSLIRMTPIKTK